MTRGTRAVLIGAGVAALLAYGAVAAMAFAVVRGGMLRVEVDDHESGTSVSLALPAAVATVGMVAVRGAVEEEDLAEVRERLAELRPGLDALLDSLEELPDALLLEVEDRDDHVWIHARDGDLEIRVESDDADVGVTVPASFLRDVVGWIEG